MNLFLPYLKAYAALIGAVGTALVTVCTDETWLTVVVIVATAIATFQVPNLDPQARHQDESVQPPEV